ncbi:MAG TPA: hypothetical protein VMS12_00530 [Thermoanaerobaculia bacterium]|nr:hypothetical protein [Thermoanaerobaculia bacterium]
MRSSVAFALDLGRFALHRMIVRALSPISDTRGNSCDPAGSLDIIRLAVLLLVAGLSSPLVPLHAQIGSDAVPQQRIISERELLESQLEHSRIRLGSVRVQPLFALRSLGYDSNVFSSFDGEETGDWTATVAAGARAIVPAGRKVFIRGDGVAEYAWYEEQTLQRNLGWDAGASVLGLFNRMSAEVSGRTSETVGAVNSELDLPVVRNISSVIGRTELHMLPRTSFFAEAEARDHENSLRVEDPDSFPEVELLDRADAGWRVGARYAWSNSVDVSVASEWTRTRFDREERELDNEGVAFLAGIRISRPLYFLNVSGGYRSIELIASPVDYSTLTGSYFASRNFARRIDAEAFGRRNISYGLFADTPFFVETRNGVASAVRMGRRTRVRAFVEAGNNDYPAGVSTGGPESAGRFDRVRTVGGSLSVLLFRSAELTIQVSDTDFNSNIEGFDRSVFRVTSGITFRGDRF